MMVWGREGWVHTDERPAEWLPEGPLDGEPVAPSFSLVALMVFCGLLGMGVGLLMRFLGRGS